MKLEPWQAERVGRVIHPMLGYLYRLRLRLRAEQVFDPNDRLFLLIDQACNDMHALAVELHYRACRSGWLNPGGKPTGPAYRIRSLISARRRSKSGE
jgi:hypothetical protein